MISVFFSSDEVPEFPIWKFVKTNPQFRLIRFGPGLDKSSLIQNHWHAFERKTYTAIDVVVIVFKRDLSKTDHISFSSLKTINTLNRKW